MRTRWPSEYRRRPTGQPSPRVALAARLYATAVCRTQREASIAAGLNPNGLSYHRFQHRDMHMQLESQIQSAIDEKAISASALIQQLSLKAVRTVEATMEGDDPKLALDAAKDLLDRNPETSKTQKISTESFLVRPTDIAALGAILRESERLSPLPPGDSVQLPVAVPSLPSTSEEL